MVPTNASDAESGQSLKKNNLYLENIMGHAVEYDTTIQGEFLIWTKRTEISQMFM